MRNTHETVDNGPFHDVELKLDKRASGYGPIELVQAKNISKDAEVLLFNWDSVQRLHDALGRALANRPDERVLRRRPGIGEAVAVMNRAAGHAHGFRRRVVAADVEADAVRLEGDVHWFRWNGSAYVFEQYDKLALVEWRE